MNEREARYSQPKLELYGLFRALRAYRLHLYGVKKLQVEVDAKYIKGMLNEPDLQPNATINRWIQGILLFDFQLIHVPADKHKGPDALSRREPEDKDFDGLEDDSWVDDIALLVGIPQEAVQVLSDLLSKSDQLLADIFRFLTTLQFPELPNRQAKARFIRQVARYFVKDGVMYRRHSSQIPKKVIFRISKRQDILYEAHEGLGHRGEYAVMQTCKERFYWPSMWNDIRKHVRSCHQCQIRSIRKVEIPLTVSMPVSLFVKLYLDIMYMPVAKGF